MTTKRLKNGSPSCFWATFESLSGQPPRVTWESLLRHFWVTLLRGLWWCRRWGDEVTAMSSCERSVTSLLGVLYAFFVETEGHTLTLTVSHSQPFWTVQRTRSWNHSDTTSLLQLPLQGMLRRENMNMILKWCLPNCHWKSVTKLKLEWGSITPNLLFEVFLEQQSLEREKAQNAQV